MMMAAGRSQAEIMWAGRWRSNAVFTYMRPGPEMEQASSALVPDAGQMMMPVSAWP